MAEDKYLTLVDLAKGKFESGNYIFKAVNEIKDEKSKEVHNDLCTFAKSQSTAIVGGNRNACIVKEQNEKIAKNIQQISNSENEKTRISHHSRPKRTLDGQTPNIKRTTTPIGLPNSISATGGTKVNNFKKNYQGQLSGSYFQDSTYNVRNVENATVGDKKSVENFLKAQAGSKETTLGDRAIVFTNNGTPLYGSDVINKAAKENLSANLANDNATITGVPRTIGKSSPVSAKRITKVPNGQIRPKSNSVGNMLLLAGIGAAIIAIMVVIQGVINTVNFLMQVQQLALNTSNLAKTFTTIINNIGVLMGFENGILKPIEETMDNMLNQTFGKENVIIVKREFNKLNTIFQAGFNVLDRIRSTSQVLANGIATTHNAEAKVFNGLKAAGIIDERFNWMEEQLQISVENSRFALLNAALVDINAIADDVDAITKEMVDARKNLDKFDKEAEDALDKADKENYFKERYGGTYTIPPVNPDTV